MFAGRTLNITAVFWNGICGHLILRGAIWAGQSHSVKSPFIDF